MHNSRELIAAFQELNDSQDRNTGYFSPGLVGMFGSIALMNDFLADLDEAFSNQSIPQSLNSRAKNLTKTFIPQVAALNSISDLSAQDISVDALRGIRSDSPTSRGEGVKIILAALTHICNQSCTMGDRF